MNFNFRALSGFCAATCLVAMVAVVNPTKGQSIVLQDDFAANANNWLLSTASGTTNDWRWLATEGVGATGCLRTKTAVSSGFALSQGISLTAGSSYTIEFDASANTANTRQLVFAVNTTQSRNGSEVIKLTTPNLPTAFTQYTSTFTVGASGTYYLLYYATPVSGSPSIIYTRLDNVKLTLQNQAPIVSLTAPTNGQVVVGGSLTLAANAADADFNLSKVEFYVDGSKVGEDLSSPFTLPYSAAVGNRSVYARAIDAVGAATNSATVNFSVPANQPPTVSFISPTANSVVAAGTTTLNASATDPDGTIASVAFYEGATLLGTDNSSPFSISYSFSFGTHSLTAIAIDNQGATGQGTLFFTSNQLPTVSLTLPVNNATVEAGNLTLRATVSDVDGTIDVVEFFANGVKLGEDATSPFSYVYAATVGSHTLYAKAIDDAGFSAQSATASITVVAPIAQLFFFEDLNASLGQIYLPNPSSSNNWQYWTIGKGIGGTNSLHNKLCIATDYFATPLLTLVATKEYNFIYNARLDQGTGDRRIVVAYNTVRSLTGATPFDTVRLPTNSYAQPPYTEFVSQLAVPADGNYYVLAYSIGTNYSDLHVDNVSFERNIVPTASLTAPASGASFNEGAGPVTIIANASDDGSIKKVEFYADGIKVGEDTTAPYAYDWASYMPGQHTVQAKAIDNRGNVTPTATAGITINFADGTLTKYVHWGFEQTIAPWIAVNDGVVYKTTLGYLASNCIYYSTHPTTGGWLQSPKVYLLAGSTYKLEWRGKSVGSTLKTCNWYIAQTPSQSGGTLIQSVGVNLATDYALQSTTFTVPATGGYYLIYNTTQTGSPQVYLDEIRLRGNINESPQVSITSPLATTIVAEGVALNLTATATDPDGTISAVRFYVNGVFVGTDNTAPYIATATGLAPGNYALTAEADDANGTTTLSLPINISVDANRLTTSTYLGGSASDDAVRGSAILPDGTTALAANISNAAPGGLTPILLGGATSANGAAIIKLAVDGKTITSVTRLRGTAVDLSSDSLGNLYVALGTGGMAKLNSAANQILWAQTFDKAVHRIDAAKDGHSALVTRPDSSYDMEQTTNATIRVLNPSGVQLSSYGGASTWNNDVCIDGKSQTIITIGTKNFNTPGEPNTTAYPVYVPVIKGHSYTSVLKYDAYDWDSDQNSPRWLNKAENNMADTKTERCAIGEDGNLYVTFEVAGGNHILRYDPFNNLLQVPVVGGDNYAGFSNTTTAPKLFVCRYVPATGAHLLGQGFTPRLSNGKDNTIRTYNGDIAADKLGRVFATGNAAAGLPITVNYIPGGYTGGTVLVTFSPDFATRELVTHYSTSGTARTVAVRGNRMVVGGSTIASDLFTYQPAQASMAGSGDGFYATADYSGLYSWNPASIHPRLYFSASDLTALRAKASTGPFNLMVAKMDSLRLKGDFGNTLQDTNDVYHATNRASLSAFLYLIKQDEAYARDARKWVTKGINGQLGFAWASTSVKGLTSYFMAKRVAECYDWCFASPNWDDNFKYTVSTKLKAIGDVIAANGGTEQATDNASNWQGARSASALLAYLAMDHPESLTNYNAMWSKVNSYITANLGTATASKGWNLEGMNYTCYPWGNFIGPMGIAIKRKDVTKDIRTMQSVRNTYWTTLASHSSAMDVRGFGTLHPDWTDDEPSGNGEGVYGQAFYYLDSTLVAPFKHWYDRTQGTLSPYTPKWDNTRGGTVWSYLYYPSVASSNPIASTDWRSRFVDVTTGSNGLQTYRNAYQNADDHIAQFKIKLRNSSGAHDGPDALGFRIIGASNAWVVGGGRNTPGNYIMQPGLYKVNPFVTAPTVNRNLGTVVGTPVSTATGGGHAIGSHSSTDNVGVAGHKRWFVANYNTAATGADAIYIIGDESTDGLFWELPTFAGHAITTSGNTFTVTAANGATMKGTVLYPTGSPAFATGRSLRGSAFGDTLNNKWITAQSSNGDYLVVLTIRKTGSHPTVAYTGTGVTGATVTVGSATFNLTATDVIYGGGARMGQHDALSGVSLQIMPNPSPRGQATLYAHNLANNMPLTITDIQGRVIASSQVDNGRNLLPYLSPGLYLARIGNTQTIRFVVE